MSREKFKFENLKVYRRTRELVRHIYLVTKGWPKDYLYDLTVQLRRAVLSILLNIAEGSGRSKKEFSRYLDIARGSCNECVALVDLALELGLLSSNRAKEILAELTEIAMMLRGLKKSLR